MRASRVLRVTFTLVAIVAEPLWAQVDAEGGGGLFDINVGLSAWTLIVFLGLLAVLGRYAWAPILQAVETREKGIQSALDEAEKRNEDAAKLLAEHREQLADARRQANELIAEGRAAGEVVRKDIEVKARAQAMADRARAEIVRERDAALDALRRESVELALAAASRLIKENLDQKKDREIVERYLSGLGERGGAQA